MFSISFVNHAQDVIDVRNYLKSLGDNDGFIIAKVESEKGVENLDEIIEAADGVMVARGDLADEFPFARVPQIQRMIIEGDLKYHNFTNKKINYYHQLYIPMYLTMDLFLIHMFYYLMYPTHKPDQIHHRIFHPISLFQL